jgi:hypothetical protein
MPRLERTGYSDGGGSRWETVPEDLETHELSYLQEASDHEIYQNAFADKDELELSEREENDALVDEMSGIEGWDGQPVSLSEFAASTEQGVGNGIDRPLEHQRQLDVDAENQALREEIARLRNDQQTTVDLYNPEIAEQRRRQRDAFLDQHGIMAFDDQKADALFMQMAGTQAREQQLRDNWVRDSIDAQRAEYGDRAVDTAIAAFGRLDQNSPMARAIDQHVYGSADPGETFMALVHNSDAVASMGRGPWRVQSHAPGRRPSRPSSYNAPESEDSGFGNEEIERDIYDSAWR